MKPLALCLLALLPAAARAQGDEREYPIDIISSIGQDPSQIDLDPHVTDAEEQFQRGLRALEGEGREMNYAEAVAWFRRAADQKHPAATYYIGKLYEEAPGMSRDHEAALGWWFRAADLGNARAQREVALHYASGDVEGRIKPDFARAVSWYRKAAEQGDAQSMTMLAAFYRSGEGLDMRDFREALRWDLKAAAKGEPVAYTDLGGAYERGEGVDTSLLKAYAYYLRGSRGGDPKAKESVDRLIGHLTEKQVLQAEQVAKDPDDTPER